MVFRCVLAALSILSALQLCAAKGKKPEKWVDYWTEQDMVVFKYYIEEVLLNGEW